MGHDERITQEMLALLGETVRHFIREGIPFELHALSQAMQKLKESEIDDEVKVRYEGMIRLLSELMH
ncbi:hypothetical protein QMZ30_00475 [Pantoea sp. EA-12]|uniref:hypothetical protein n=1 Tax=Pantoea sp. EA-12 TaxID=3043303 RepID=UPI0024B53302|nr:hypothetical protein [Pantoea sp. EA-12]MDI9219368.1 hypothetical protein [Pantoea sp. EA-12]